MTQPTAAPARPVPATPRRQPRSVRRSSVMDVARVGGDPLAVTADLLVDGSVSDLRTGHEGSTEVLGLARTRASVTSARQVVSLEAEPVAGDLSALLGLSAGSGWRRAVQTLVPGGATTPLGLLLDDLPIAVLLAPYAAVRAGLLGDPGALQAASGRMRDYCSGWAGDATMLRSIDAGEGMPQMPFVPAPAPTADCDDPAPAPPLAPGALRRARRIDVAARRPDRTRLVEAAFRDSWQDVTGGEAVLHEYVVRLTLDADDVVREIEVEPRVLPWTECPTAAASTRQLLGADLVTAARELVPSFSGRGSCTHLNDLLRSLVCVPSLGGAADR